MKGIGRGPISLPYAVKTDGESGEVLKEGT